MEVKFVDFADKNPRIIILNKDNEWAGIFGLDFKQNFEDAISHIWANLAHNGREKNREIVLAIFNTPKTKKENNEMLKKFQESIRHELNIRAARQQDSKIDYYFFDFYARITYIPGHFRK
ncbi:MAG: hypothetical protein WC842_01875 [Candidatus Paceibacterota bacterium]|jgi:hypothetical protein